MARITTIDEANAALFPYVPLVGQLTGKDKTLDRVAPLMSYLGDPQDKTRVIHIAGTSGKTSTAYFTAALMSTTGKKVGLTVSPHVDSITERVQVNGAPLSDKTFCGYLSEFLQLIEVAPIKPSYFELLTAFSFWVFEREAVDYAVIETGLGGLFDATNIVSRPDKVCVITDIGFDHMNILGNTIEQIAAQKAGIIQRHNSVIMYAQSAAVNQVFKVQADVADAELILTTEEAANKAYGISLAPETPEFQRRNWLLARSAFQYVQERDNLPAVEASVLSDTQSLQVPGRMDHRQVGDTLIVMDGAHNGQKMETFLRSFSHAYPDEKPAVLIALKEGKEPSAVAPMLAPIASEIIVTTFDTSQDLPAKSIDPNELAGIFKTAGAVHISVEPDHRQAYQKLLATKSKIVIITGSFYLLSQIRKDEHLG